MTSGWAYRFAAVGGSAALAVLAVAVASHPAVLALLAVVPVVGDLAREGANGQELWFEAATTATVVLASLVPMFKPRPRRILDIAERSIKRVFVGIIALAAIGYFDWTYKLPRATLIVAGGVLMATVPVWFVLIRRRATAGGGRVVVIGHDGDPMREVLPAVDGEVIGYVSPPTSAVDGVARATTRTVGYADGGHPRLDDLPCLGGLSRLDEVLVEYDVDTAVLAFEEPDRAEFFGALDSCYEHGVAAMAHRDHASVVLTEDIGGGTLVTVDLEPLDPQDHVLKRLFDVVFAWVGLVVLFPVVVAVAVAIKLEDGGPILYAQARTTTFGDTFRVFKFRSMVPDAESGSGARLSAEDRGGVDPRVTRVGRIIRPTHLDEIPQLWSILVGDMSVVGPRPERPELDRDMELGVAEWRSRWFVKPGLTGLAQINEATGYDPEAKLRYDVEYIRQQSFWFDLKIVVRQVWMVLGDVRAFFGEGREE